MSYSFLKVCFEKITANGLGIAEGGDFFAQNFNRNTAVQILQKS
jgi:hypothetical protein